MKKVLLLFAFFALASSDASAQSSFEEFQKKVKKEFGDFKTKTENEYDEFRRKVNAEYAEMVRKAWKEYNALAGIPIKEKDKPAPPIKYPEKDKDKPVKDTPKPIDVVVKPVTPKPQPEPIAPIEEKEDPVPTYLTFNFYGAQMQVRYDDNAKVNLRSVNANGIADAWVNLSNSDLNNTISDLLSLRSKYKMCDWAYLSLLNTFAQKVKSSKNEATLLTAFLYSQSGYKMRMATSGNTIVMLYASDALVYKVGYYLIEGEKFYPYNHEGKNLSICAAKYPKERAMSFYISSEQHFGTSKSDMRTIQSKRYESMKATCRTNKTLMDFYNTYPTSSVNDDFGTRWALYANTPVTAEAKSTLYPQLKAALTGKSEAVAVNMLLNWVQTGFVYEYDDKVWGGDRAFFPDETLYYPYCDCEDRSILFTRLVRDLLGLKCILIYYPGHLATAVHFTKDDVTGDYVSVGGVRYVISDPTYIGAPVGATMPGMNNGSAKAILLD